MDLPHRDRPTHADKLMACLSQAWQVAENRQVAADVERRGIFLEFAGAPGHELKTKSLEDRRAGIRLLNVREEMVGDQRQTLATVFIPKHKNAYFLKKIRDYKEQDTAPNQKGETKPQNQPLVASIDDIRDAFLKSFWTDDPALIPGDTPIWNEIWLSTNDPEETEKARTELIGAGLVEHEGRPELHFPERTVLLMRANREGLLLTIDSLDSLAEIRAAREPSSFFAELSNAEQAEWVQNLLDRSSYDMDSSVAVCILDSGINNGHPLLSAILSAEDTQAADPNWSTHDHDGHGTRMAGLATYGDLQAVLESGGEILIRHRLESVKILPPPPATTPKHLWGSVTADGISRAEIQAPNRKRVICLAVTSTETKDRGRPTSWSGEIDQLASGSEVSPIQRLILVSAGNVRDPDEWASYPASNITSEIHDPAQAWNAVTVGAYTNRIQITHPDYSDHVAIAPAGLLSPYSTTSVTWAHNKWPIKPDVVFEGGNVARSPDGQAFDIDDLQLLSTYHRIVDSHFVRFNATSAAVAQAAHFAVTVQAEYPEAWPETIRGLMIHSAEWTAAMLEELPEAGKLGFARLLRCYGYGVPNLEKAIHCLSSRLTLIEQASLQPYKRRENGSGYHTNQLNFHRLPWPTEALEDLGESPVRMRVTLSYFVEPSPGQIGWKDRYRYSSHGLRFELNGPGESEEDFLKRINQLARLEEEGHPGTSSPSGHWTLGQQRDVGSIHSDIWTGTAVELASSSFIAVRPTVGWWRERPHLGGALKRARYTLVVSIETVSQEVDLYTPVLNQIELPIEIGVENN